MVMREIANHVGRHFNVIRCAYGEVSPGKIRSPSRALHEDVPTVAGRYPLEVFGLLMAGELKAGHTVSINDVRTDPLTDTPLAHETYARMQIVSLVCVPLSRGGSSRRCW